MATTVTWSGASGTKYTYYLYEIGHKLQAAGGNYIFCKAARPGSGYAWEGIYIGQTNNLDLRFDNHHKAACINRNGATHICAHLEPDERKRLAEEADLIAAMTTSCND